MKSLLLLAFLLCFVAFTGYGQNNKILNVGDKVPIFQALIDTGSAWNFSNYTGKKYVVVYLYPAALTGGCTTQTCTYRDSQAGIEAANAVVVGISGDNAEGLNLFKKSENLNFTLLSDESDEIAKSFGVPAKDRGKITREIEGKSYILVRGATACRWTFIIDKKGNIVYKNEQLGATKDTEEVLKFLKNKS